MIRELQERFNLLDSQWVIIAASTHAPEEQIIIDALRELINDSPSASPRMIIAPRHPERFAEVADLLANSGLTWSRRTDAPKHQDRVSEVVLLDTVGELAAAYSLGKVVFVGGSIAKKGGHNILEPATRSRAVVTGHHTFNFAGIVKTFLDADALVQLPPLEGTAAASTLAKCFRDLLLDDKRRCALAERACATVAAHQGATTRTVNSVSELTRLTLK
ncbi:MAG: hypothetical protein WKF84_17925 [Pyrinomonadaceae bacterium]